MSAVNSSAALLSALEAIWAATKGDPEHCIKVLAGPVDLFHSCCKGANLQRIETLASCVPD